jgi:transglutaminase 1
LPSIYFLYPHQTPIRQIFASAYLAHTLEARSQITHVSLFHSRHTDSVSLDILSIEKVDLCAARNGKSHHTDRFDLMKREVPKLVVRRGQVFKLQLHCNRPYNMERDAISLIFSVADVEKPSFGHGTLIALSLKNRSTDLGKSTEWGASVNSINGDLLEILIKPSAGALVTQWKMDIDTKVLDNSLSRSFSLPQPFYLLFNPWCREDEVYLEGKKITVILKFEFSNIYFR